MIGWRGLVDGFRDAVVASTRGARPAPTVPFGDGASDDARRLPGLGAQDPMVRDLMLARLRARDPAFDPDAFVRGAVAAFTAVETAWADLDPQRSRRYLAAALWSSHRARIELYALHGRRNHLDGLAVQGAAIAGVECGDGPDRITVRITARSADYDTDASGAVVRGDRLAFDWQGDWVFQRSGAAATPASGGVLAQRCPGCGAPLDVDDAGCCATCHAPVMDGSGDWVIVAAEACDEEQSRLDALLGVRSLTRDDGRGHAVVERHVVAVERGDASTPPPPAHDAAALAVLRACDPDFVPAGVCDHARNAFAAVRSAWATMDAGAACPYLSEAAHARLVDEIAGVAARGLHRVADDPLVDGVAIVDATDREGVLAAVCAVTAEVVDADAAADGTVVRGTTELSHAECRLTFRRWDLARSPGSGVTVMRCPRCGAPMRASALEPCLWCKRAIADGGGSWVLADVGELTPLRCAPEAAATPPPAVASEGPLQSLLAVDPTVNPAEVLVAARDAFFAVEASTAHLNPAAVADRLTPAALALHADRLEHLRAAGHSLRQAFVDLTGASVVAGTVDPGGSPRVTVRLRVSGDVDEVDAAGRVVAGPGRVVAWTEDWELVRASPGAPWLVAAMRLPGAAPDAAA